MGVSSCSCSIAWLGDLATDRIDRDILLVMGRWLGVGRVGVLKMPWLTLELGGGVDGRAGGVPNSSSRSSCRLFPGVTGGTGLAFSFSLDGAFAP